jgi:hypothetical protein
MAVVVVMLVIFPVPMTVAMPVVLVATPMAIVVISMVFVLAVVIAVVVVVLFTEFISMEIRFPTAMSAPVGTFAASRERPSVSESRIVVVVDLTMKALRPAEPWPGAQKHATDKPLWALVAKWRAGIRRVGVVAVGADRRDSNVDADLRG